MYRSNPDLSPFVQPSKASWEVLVQEFDKKLCIFMSCMFPQRFGRYSPAKFNQPHIASTFYYFPGIITNFWYHYQFQHSFVGGWLWRWILQISGRVRLHVILIFIRLKFHQQLMLQLWIDGCITYWEIKLYASKTFLSKKYKKKIK